MAKNNINPLDQDLFFHKCIFTPKLISLKTRRSLDPCEEKMCGDLKSPKTDQKNCLSKLYGFLFILFIPFPLQKEKLSYNYIREKLTTYYEKKNFYCSGE